jgi:hypothetical protein
MLRIMTSGPFKFVLQPEAVRNRMKVKGEDASLRNVNCPSEALTEQNHTNVIVGRAHSASGPPISRTIAGTLLDESMN